MDNELFDIVDEDDKVVGQCTRKEAHTKGHLHRSVLFFIFDDQGRIFVNKRSETKEFYPGYYSLVFGGHVPSGESYEAAVIREAKEEAGIEGKPFLMDSFKKRFDKEDPENIKVYGFTADKELRIDPNEVVNGEFMDIEQIEQKIKEENFLPETPILFRILKDYKKK